MFVKRSLIVAATLCGAAACSEAHLDGRSPEAFHASVLKMGAEREVTAAQHFGDDILKVEAIVGTDDVRGHLDGMTYSDAHAYLKRVLIQDALKPASPTVSP